LPHCLIASLPHCLIASLPVINKFNLFNFITEAYYVGITEVYRPYGQDLIYMDVNSLYPYTAIKDYREITYIAIAAIEGELDLDQ
jgi:hypothetical protein